ncbi:MAG TPA: helix-turn-helix domain-containing protein, partial [Roseiflexaceae bacterium]|nr:helix-turn-helix domain-containing protein [Roseiflexaceae bacterium]
METPTSFGSWVRRRRKALALSQAELAERVGCAIVTIQKIEADQRRPSRKIAERLAHDLALPLQERDAFLRAARAELGVDRRTDPTHTTAAPAALLGRPLGNLPAQATLFIGRDRERMLVRVLLRRAEVRLLTLTGPGGAGKTRLALQAAAELSDDFADGVVFVGLASISDPALVIPTIAKALGVSDAGDHLMSVRVSGALQNKQLLLLLDNFEQVLPAAPDIAALLAVAPGVKVLVTSRAALHLSWEHEFTVPPLAVPNPGMLPALDQLWQYDAVQLFVTRAQAVSHDFALTDDNAAIVADICRRLDGLPLAIELATARVKVFSPLALLARLDRRLALLTDGPHDMPARQQTLRATIDWSYNLLAPAERTLFAALGVFAGGCTIELAEAVVQFAAPTAGRSHILDGLVSLTSQSLLQHAQGQAGEPRFVMLETIREYALEQLGASGQAPAIRRTHAEVFLALAEAGAAALEGAEQGAWLGRLEQEHDNLRAA